MMSAPSAERPNPPRSLQHRDGKDIRLAVKLQSWTTAGRCGAKHPAASLRLLRRD
jgi:hypothetical protein